MKVLEIGAGGRVRSLESIGGKIDLTVLDARMDEFTDVVHAITTTNTLPFDDETFDAVYNSHILEHLPYFYEKPILKDWVRVIKPGGTLHTVVPAWEWVAKQVLMPPEKRSRFLKNMAMAGQQNEWDFHFNMFTMDMLETLYRQCRLEVRTKQTRPMTYIVMHHKVRLEEHFIVGVK